MENRSVKRVLVVISTVLLSFLYFQVSFADTLNQRSRLFVDPDFDYSGRSSVNATLRFIGDHAYYYVDDTYFDGLDSSEKTKFINTIGSLADIFDEKIYSREVALFGSEPNPGIDGDPRLYILLEKTKDNTGGYINTDNFLEKGTRLESNKKEILFLNAAVVKGSPSLAEAFLAHEFQHVISFKQKELNNKVQEDVWLNELRSEYAVTAIGMNEPFGQSHLDRRFRSFLVSPSNSLVEWPNEVEDYGIAAMLGEYMVQRFGPGLLSETIKYDSIGITSIDKFLIPKGYSFESLFLDWMTAVYPNDSLLGSQLIYQNQNLRSGNITPQRYVSLSAYDELAILSGSLKPWQPLWSSVAVSQGTGKSLKISLSPSAGSSFVGRVIVYHGNGSTTISDFSRYDPTVYTVDDGSGINKLLVLVVNVGKTSGFTTSESSNSFSVWFEWVDSSEVENEIKDGNLIKKQGQPEVYVVLGKYKRYLSPEVIKLYGHLDPSRAIAVSSEKFDSYITSNYVKNINEEKVYAVWSDNTKHWLNMTGEYFTQSGRDWGAMFIINDLELNYYKIGLDITR